MPTTFLASPIVLHSFEIITLYLEMLNPNKNALKEPNTNSRLFKLNNNTQQFRGFDVLAQAINYSYRSAGVEALWNP